MKRCTAAPSIPCSRIQAKCFATTDGFCAEYSFTVPRPSRRGRPVSHSSSGFSSRTEGRTSTVRRSEEHTSELQSPCNLVCRLLLEKKKKQSSDYSPAAQVTS